MKNYEAMGNEMTKDLGMENKKVILYWKAFEEKRYAACNFHYGCYKKGLTNLSTLWYNRFIKRKKERFRNEF